MLNPIEKFNVKILHMKNTWLESLQLICDDMADYHYFAQIKKTLSVPFAYRKKIMAKVKQIPSPPHLKSTKHWMTP